MLPHDLGTRSSSVDKALPLLRLHSKHEMTEIRGFCLNTGQEAGLYCKASSASDGALWVKR